MTEINTRRITRDFCDGRKLVFHPKTPEEARIIQEKIFTMGFAWRKGETTPLYLDMLTTSTLYLEDGVMHYDDEGRKTDGILCDVAQFDPKYVYAPPKTIDDVFNLVAAMQKEIDMLRQQVADLHKEVMPKPLEKPSIDILKQKGLK